MLVDSLPPYLQVKLKSVIKLSFKVKMERDPQIAAHLWNKNEHKYTKIAELKQFPDIVEENEFNFKYRQADGSGTLHDCLPISDWISQVPFVTNASASSESFNTPTDSPMKKARTQKDL